MNVSIKVTGAGVEEANGTYYPTDQKSDGTPTYSKSGRNRNNSIDDTFFMGRSEDGTWWILTGEAWTENKISHYSINTNKLTLPPEVGWVVVNHKFAPAPNITILRHDFEKTSSFRKIIKKMISDNFSDVHFHCEDGTILHSNKALLSTVSPYFETVFEGLWDDEHPDGVWKTSNSAVSMNIVLVYLHSLGKNIDGVSKEPLEVLSLAHEYQLTELVNVTEVILIQKTEEENLKEHLQAAILYNLEKLKSFCIKFVRKLMNEVTVNDEFLLNLVTKKSDLWDGLRSFLSNKQEDSSVGG